jgi:hypothetical protein
MEDLCQRAMSEMNQQMGETVAVVSGVRGDLRILQGPASIRSRINYNKGSSLNLPLS